LQLLLRAFTPHKDNSVSSFIKQSDKALYALAASQDYFEFIPLVNGPVRAEPGFDLEAMTQKKRAPLHA
jgi:hypothetical protein